MKKELMYELAKKEVRKEELEAKRNALLDESDKLEIDETDQEKSKAVVTRAKEIRTEVRSIGEHLKALEQEIKEAREKLEKEEEEKPQEEPGGEEPKPEEGRSEQRNGDWVKVEQKGLKKVYSSVGGTRNMKLENLEQRQAFMEGVLTGDLSKLEKREVTNTGDVTYVIPQNLVNDIITEVKNRGYILSKITRTSFPVGQVIPVGLIDIKATWVGKKSGTQLEKSGEGLGSSVQKGGVEATVTFFNYKLRCEIALTYETSIQALAVFESRFVQQLSDAMVDELELAVVSGDGINQPKGILLETPNTGKALTITSGTKLTYADMIKFIGAVPRKYRKGAVAFMTQNSFNEFMSIVDENGQPVAKVNTGVDGEPVYRLFGMPVELADEFLDDYALSVEKDTIFAFIYNFKEYVLNTNYDLGVKTKEDWDTEDKHWKAVLAADGKAVTKYSYVTFTVKAGASA